MFKNSPRSAIAPLKTELKVGPLVSTTSVVHKGSQMESVDHPDLCFFFVFFVRGIVIEKRKWNIWWYKVEYWYTELRSSSSYRKASHEMADEEGTAR